jgi:acetolactate synthase-1/2/3 large subunit
VDLHTPDFRALAGSVALGYARIERAEDAARTVAGAVAGEGPTLVEVDVDLLGPMVVPFTPPVDVPEEVQ